MTMKMPVPINVFSDRLKIGFIFISLSCCADNVLPIFRQSLDKQST